MKLRFISSALAAALFAATGSYAAVVDLSLIHISTIIDEFSRVFSHIGSNSSSVPGDPLITN